MPTGEYYCTDNFFTKMTDLESPKKNNDCYFYYYSTCSKGDSCGFRHEPSALGCETMCSFWKEGKCLNIHCNFRHMELRKNRKAIPCYWESQPGGCLKPHCPFMHQNVSGHSLNPNDSKLNKTEPSLSENCTQAGNFKSTSSVDSLVVNFEEESDTESAPPITPVKTPKVKTLEEIKLEKIAAECAAYYYHNDSDIINEQLLTVGKQDLRQRIMQKIKLKDSSKRTLALRLSPSEIANILVDNTINTSEYPPFKKRKVDSEIVKDIKIKTLEEIRAERNERNTDIEKSPRKLTPSGEAEVSSTSNDEPETFTYSTSISTIQKAPLKPLRKLNLQKIKAGLEQEQKTSERAPSNDCNIEKAIVNEPGNLDINEPSKTVDESLLLMEDVEEDISLNPKSEDDLLKEIDNLLED